MIFLDIAEEALSRMHALDKDNAFANPDGKGGYVIKLDPERKSFKQALIAISFSCAFFEALVFIKLSEMYAGKKLTKNDNAFYEDRLKALSVKDSAFTAKAERLRKIRKDIFHEKATSSLEGKNIWYAQTEAEFAVEYVKRVAELLGYSFSKRA